MKYSVMNLTKIDVGYMTHRLPTRMSTARGPGPDVPNGTLHSVTQQLPHPPPPPPPPTTPSVHFSIMPIVGSTCARIDELTLPPLPRRSPDSYRLRR